MLTLENTTLEFKGISSANGHSEDRILVYFEVISDNDVYEWMRYAPNTTSNFGEYIESIKQSVIDDINNKETIWENGPKVGEAEDPLTGELIIFDVDRNSIVRPDIPDYYALRRSEYPSFGEQLGAIFKGPESTDYQNVLNKIQEIKAKYPKV